MPIAQIIALLYAGMLIESPQKRQQFIGFLNNAGVSVEKIVNNFTNKGGVAKDVSAATEESELK